MVYDINTGEELGGGESSGDERVAGLTRQVEDLAVVLRSDDTKAALVGFVDRVRVLGEALREASRTVSADCDGDALVFERAKNHRMWETIQVLRADADTSKEMVAALVLRVAVLEAEGGSGVNPVRKRVANHEDQSRFARSARAAGKLGRDWTLVRGVYDELCGLGCRFCGGDIGRGIGLGREDLTMGFVDGNVFPCCGRCGRIRGDRFTPEEMVVLVGGG